VEDRPDSERSELDDPEPDPPLEPEVPLELDRPAGLDPFFDPAATGSLGVDEGLSFFSPLSPDPSPDPSPDEPLSDFSLPSPLPFEAEAAAARESLR
jgi:hypothetical protein